MSEDTRNHLGHGNMTKMITFFIIGFFILGPRECWGLGDANDTKWWENALFYDVSWPFNEHSHSYENLRALIKDIDNMKEVRVDALCLQPIFPWQIDPYSIASYTAVNEALGTIDDIAELIEMAHNNDIVPFYTSDQHEWFQRWEQNIGRYGGFYLSMMDIEPDLYWLWSTKRKMAYRRIYGKKSPMLNLDMESVRRQLNEVNIFLNLLRSNFQAIATFWLNIGVDGFRIIDFSIYLLSSMNYDEELTLVESTKNYLNGMREHVDKWTTKRNSTSKYLAVELTTKGRDWSLYNTMKDLPGVVLLNNVLLSINSATPSGKNATWLKELILSKLNAIPPGASIRWMLWHWSYPSLPSGVGARNAAALTMLMMLLPGQARVLMANERNVEEDSWSSTKVDLSTVPDCYACPFARIIELRKLVVFGQGQYDLEALNDNAVLALRRHTSDDPNVYTAVINLTDREEKISPTELFPDLGERLEILFNTDANATTIGSVPHHDSVSVPAHSGMVLMSARTKRETSKDAESPKKESEGKTDKTKISGEKEPSGGGEGGTTVPTVGKGESAMPSQHGQSETTETNKDAGTPKNEGEGKTEKTKISGEKEPSGGGEGGTTVPTVGKGESAMPSQHGQSGTTETNKDVGTPKKEGEGRTEKTKISGEKEPSGGGEGGTTVPTVGKGESAMPSKHHESGTTETYKHVGTPKEESEARTEKTKISGEKDQGKGDVEGKSVGKGGEKPSRSGKDAAAKGKEDEKVHERVEDDPKGKRKEINNDEGHVGHEKATGVLKGIGKFWRSIGQLCAGYWRKKLETASLPKTYRWNRQ